MRARRRAETHGNSALPTPLPSAQGASLSVELALRQTFPEAFRYRLEERVRDLAVVDRHLLAVPRDLVQPVGGDPIVAGAAHDQVLARRTVPSEDHVVARSGGKSVFLRVGLVAVNQVVVTFPARYIVGALGAKNRIVATTAHQVIVA